MRLAALPTFLRLTSLLVIGCASSSGAPVSAGAGGSSSRGGAGGSAGTSAAAGASGANGAPGGKGGSSIDPCSGSSVDGSAAGGLACSAPLASDCHLPGTTTSYGCTLDETCAQCAGGCGPQSLFIEGGMYDYVELLNVDVATVLVYDKKGMLVAELYWGANTSQGRCPWTCLAGPASFDASEAMSRTPGLSSGQALASACAARARDAASD